MGSDYTEVANLAASIGKASAKVAVDVSKVVRRAALQVETEARRLVPVDTAATKNSIGFDMRGMHEASVGPQTEYAPYLEFGTAGRSPRPFMGPAADKVAPLFEEALAAAAIGALDD